MEIEVNHKELNNLGDYMKNLAEELTKDSETINSIANNLSIILHGSAEQAIVNRMKSFNANQITKLINYTNLINEEFKLASKLYNSEENDFYEKSQREVYKYE